MVFTIVGGNTRQFKLQSDNGEVIFSTARKSFLKQAKKLYVITLIPALFMTAVCSTYIFVAPEGFGLSSGFSQLLGLLVTLIVFGIFLVWKRKKV